MSTTINNHTLTTAENTVLSEVEDFMRREAGDSHWSNTSSPAGDGRWVAVDEIFCGHSNQLTANRRTLNRLGSMGILAACEIALDCGMLKGVPNEHVRNEKFPNSQYVRYEPVEPNAAYNDPHVRREILKGY